MSTTTIQNTSKEGKIEAHKNLLSDSIRLWLDLGKSQATGF